MSNTPNNQQQMNLQIRYEDMTGRYANQVMLNTTAEECYLDFSSGVIVDRATGAYADTPEIEVAAAIGGGAVTLGGNSGTNAMQVYRPTMRCE